MKTFKDIPNYEGLYRINKLGIVQSLKWNKKRELKAVKDGNGYLTVKLYSNKKGRTYPIHLLLGITFMNHKPNGTSDLVLDHINENKLDNSIENLQIVTNRENVSKSIKNKTSKLTGVSWSSDREKWVSQIVINGKTIPLGRFITEGEAAWAYQSALMSKDEFKKPIKK